MKFVCKTQQNHMAHFKGPSGEVYVSLQGMFFDVQNELDIAYFKKKKQFGTSKKEAPPAVSEEDKLKKMLVDAGFKEADQKVLMDAYETVGNLVSDVQQGADLVAVHKVPKTFVDKLLKLVENYKG